jgi:hypothetical protein
VIGRLARDRSLRHARLALHGLYDGLRGTAGPQPSGSP